MNSSQQVLQQVEELRNQYYQYIKKNLLILGIVELTIFVLSLLLTFITHLVFNGIVSLMVYSFCMISIVIAIKSSKYKRQYRMLYKQEFVQSVLNELFENVKYDYEKGFTRQEVSNMNLIQSGNLFSSEDLIEASYHGVHFRQAEVTIRNKNNSNKSSSTVTYFSGHIYEFAFPKDFMFDLYVRSRDFSHTASIDRSFQKIKLESVDFNKRFEVFTRDEHTAFYILTPQFMEKLIMIQDLYKGQISLQFRRNTLYLATNTNFDALELPKGNAPLVYEEERNRITGQLQTIINFVDWLQLDDTIIQ